MQVEDVVGACGRRVLRLLPYRLVITELGAQAHVVLEGVFITVEHPFKFGGCAPKVEPSAARRSVRLMVR